MCVEPACSRFGGMEKDPPQKDLSGETIQLSVDITGEAGSRSPRRSCRAPPRGSLNPKLPSQPHAQCFHSTQMSHTWLAARTLAQAPGSSGVPLGQKICLRFSSALISSEPGSTPICSQVQLLCDPAARQCSHPLSLRLPPPSPPAPEAIKPFPVSSVHCKHRDLRNAAMIREGVHCAYNPACVTTELFY